MTDLAGHVAVVTGGNRGIGLGMAARPGRGGRRPSRSGREGRQEEAAPPTRAPTGRRHRHLGCDVADEDQIIGRDGRDGGRARARSTHVRQRRGRRRARRSSTCRSRVAARHGRQPRRRLPTLARGPATWSSGARVGRSWRCRRCRPCTERPARSTTPRPRPRCSRSCAAWRSSWPGTASGATRSCPGWTDTEMLEPGMGNTKWVDATPAARRCAAGARPTDFGRDRRLPRRPRPDVPHGRLLVVDGGYSVF